MAHTPQCDATQSRPGAYYPITDAYSVQMGQALSKTQHYNDTSIRRVATPALEFGGKKFLNLSERQTRHACFPSPCDSMRPTWPMVLHRLSHSFQCRDQPRVVLAILHVPTAAQEVRAAVEVVQLLFYGLRLEADGIRHRQGTHHFKRILQHVHHLQPKARSYHEVEWDRFQKALPKCHSIKLNWGLSTTCASEPKAK